MHVALFLKICSARLTITNSLVLESEVHNRVPRAVLLKVPNPATDGFVARGGGRGEEQPSWLSRHFLHVIVELVDHSDVLTLAVTNVRLFRQQERV